MANDVFNRLLIDVKKPVTADMALIHWDGLLAAATQISWQYNQQITKRYTLGSNGRNTAVIYPGRPQGSMTIARLIAEDSENLFSKKGWDVCKGLATITISLDGQSAFENCNVKGGTFTFRGCFANSTGVNLNSEDLSVAESISIEFLQMEYQPA